MTVRKSEMHLRSGNVDVGWLSQAGVWPESATYERRRAIVIKRGRPLDAQSSPGLRKSGSQGGSPPFLSRRTVPRVRGIRRERQEGPVLPQFSESWAGRPR